MALGPALRVLGVACRAFHAAPVLGPDLAPGAALLAAALANGLLAAHAHTAPLQRSALVNGGGAGGGAGWVLDGSWLLEGDSGLAALASPCVAQAVLDEHTQGGGSALLARHGLAIALRLMQDGPRTVGPPLAWPLAWARSLCLCPSPPPPPPSVCERRAACFYKHLFLTLREN